MVMLEAARGFLTVPYLLAFKLASEGRRIKMAMQISDECIACGACEADCPVDAISEGDTQFEIDPDKCVECVGYFDSPQCVDVCPVDAISKA